MTKLTENRDTREIAGIDFAPLLKNAEIVYCGGMAAINVTTGEAEAAADAANLLVTGRFETSVDNSNDGERALIHSGVFHWNNSATHAVTAAYLNKKLYVEDDNTVSIDPGAHAVPAGIMVALDDEGVWVDCRPAAMAAAIGANPVAAVVAAPAALTAANPAAITAATPTGGTTTDAEARAEVVKLVTDLTAVRAEVVKLVTDLTATRSGVTGALTALKTAGLMASA